MLTSKILSSQFSNNEQLCPLVLVIQKFLGKLQYIVVISTSQALITGNNQKSHFFLMVQFFLFFLLEIHMADIRQMTQQTCHHRLKGVEIRLRIFQILLSLSHLGRGDHVHGIGDFSRILDTFDPVLDLSQSCHTTSPPDSYIPLLHLQSCPDSYDRERSRYKSLRYRPMVSPSLLLSVLMR